MTRTLLTPFIDVSILVLTRLSILGASDLSGKSALQ